MQNRIQNDTNWSQSGELSLRVLCSIETLKTSFMTNMFCKTRVGITGFFCVAFSLEEHDIKAPGKQGRPGRTATQEKGCQSPKRPKLGALQEQLRPPSVVRSGEQPPPGAHARKEEEETPEQEKHNGELMTQPHFIAFSLSASEASFLCFAVLYEKPVHNISFSL